MFLNQLNGKEKELFFSLCGYAIMADGIVELEEMESLALFCHEMAIPNHLPDTSDSLETVVDSIVEIASEQEKNIIVFELIMLFKQDGCYGEEEINFMRPIMNRFGISTEKHNKMVAVIDEYLAMYSNICDLINNA